MTWFLICYIGRGSVPADVRHVMFYVMSRQAQSIFAAPLSKASDPTFFLCQMCVISPKQYVEHTEYRQHMTVPNTLNATAA